MARRGTIDAMDLRRYDLNLLVVLDALLDEANVTRAGKRLNLTQSATSAALERLRHQFRDPLLVRSGSRMEPTALAARLRAPLKEALHAVAGAIAAPARFDPRTSALHVRLGLSDYVGLLHLPRLYRRLARAAPGISLEVIPKFKDDAIARLESGEIDLATTVDPPSRPDLFRAELLREDFACVLRRGHPLLAGKLSLSRLLEYPHVVVTAHGESAAITDQALAMRGRRRRIAVTVPVFSSAFAMLRENDLVAILPRRIASLQAASFGLVLRDPPLAIPGYTLSLVWHLRTDNDAGHRWLREQILAVVAD